MEEKDLEEIYKIEKKRLDSVFERIQNQSPDLSYIDLVAKFLVSQSIGYSYSQILKILNYYEDRIFEDFDMLKFAYEWIRAQKIRFEYKKHLINAQYPNLEIALDDCIICFFLDYDMHIRQFFKEDIKEFELSTLYEIFLANPNEKKISFSKILEKHRNRVPTFFKGVKRINTSIITLRSGLLDVVKSDYHE